MTLSDLVWCLKAWETHDNLEWYQRGEVEIQFDLKA